MNRNEYQKEYARLNSERKKLAAKLWRKNNKNKIEIYEQANKDKRKTYRDEHAKEQNRKTILRRKENNNVWVALNEYRRNWCKNKKELDMLFKLKVNIKSRITGCFNRKSVKKSIRTEQILGCSYEQFKLHLESKFEPWMNWNNYGAYRTGKERTWNIDHIIPIDSAVTESDVIRLNHYTNLRPLCSKENIDKRNKIISLC